MNYVDQTVSVTARGTNDEECVIDEPQTKFLQSARYHTFKKRIMCTNAQMCGKFL